MTEGFSLIHNKPTLQLRLLLTELDSIHSWNQPLFE